MWSKKKQADAKLGESVIGAHNVFVEADAEKPVKSDASDLVDVVFLKKAFLHWSSCKTYEAGTECAIPKRDAEVLLKTNHVSLKGKQ